MGWLSEQIFQFMDQGRQIVLDGIPHQFFINFEINMHYAIPHRAHEAPWDCRKFFFDLFGDLICRFTMLMKFISTARMDLSSSLKVS